jgi:Fur family ferric uptake transcriptional regulator
MGRHQQDLSELANRLRENNRRLTGARQTILNLLRRELHPVSAREIHEKLRDLCDLATIYRSLHLLESMQMVKRFDFGDGSARYEMIGRDNDGHHHHLICNECRKVIEISDCFPRTLEESIAHQHNFREVTHRLEFFGICPTCHPA